MAGRKVEGRAHAQACLDAVAASGLSRRDWAVAHGIDGRSLHLWHRILTRKSAVEAAPLRFVELVPATTSAPAARYRLVVGPVIIETDDGFSSEGLARLLKVVVACSA